MSEVRFLHSTIVQLLISFLSFPLIESYIGLFQHQAVWPHDLGSMIQEVGSTEERCSSDFHFYSAVLAGLVAKVHCQHHALQGYPTATACLQHESANAEVFLSLRGKMQLPRSFTSTKHRSRDGVAVVGAHVTEVLKPPATSTQYPQARLEDDDAATGLGLASEHHWDSCTVCPMATSMILQIGSTSAYPYPLLSPTGRSESNHDEPAERTAAGAPDTPRGVGPLPGRLMFLERKSSA